ncbi:site-specific integrase [Funiculus sociatus GB2-A5]|uniref:Site-specific integrase n=1 Tax=Funiculus sociatus GB2-A5 TaxID=2933946 RepID=A0ABV0JT61_9CYAN|nr:MULTISPECIES: site-specific integrase [unclassified Trichocoleus]MBD1903934.1 site-specific integrase [Trichocoleus sp. FACHB-832]MBD2060803.1 site-specific integrase [Trichocoleus sp. FACHB-6]
MATWKAFQPLHCCSVQRGYFSPGRASRPLLYPLSKAKRIIPRRMSEQGITSALQRRGEQADIAPFSPHNLRRTFISNLLDVAADIVTVSQLASHSSPSVTSRYDRRGEAAKRRAIDLLNVPYSGRNPRLSTRIRVKTDKGTRTQGISFGADDPELSTRPRCT